MGYGTMTASPDRYATLKANAKMNRHNMTPSERILWEAIRNKALGASFRRQHPIGDYIADFACLPLKLIIEVDGGYHHTPQQEADDIARTADIEKMGYQVLRFRNEEVDFNLPQVINTIKKHIV